MYYYNKYTEKILDYYRVHNELVDTVNIGFTGVASERPPAVFTNEISEDSIYWAAAVDFSNSGVLVRIQSQSPIFNWMADDAANPVDTPVNALAGVFSQAYPVLQLIQPFFIKAQGRLQMQFTNDSAAPITGGKWTWRALRLTNPINGTGWDYSIGVL